MRFVVKEIFRDEETYADRVFTSEDTFAIADGMGTGIGARVAAERAIELLGESRPFTSLDEIYSFFQKTNRRIMEDIARLGDRHVAGTTLSLVSFSGNNFLIGHVGDSRIYLKRKGEMELLTVDQIKYRGGKKLVKALGIEWNPDVVLREGSLEKGDIFLLVSDGVTGSIGEGELNKTISEDIEDSAEKIEELYHGRSLREDFSFILILVE